MKIDFFAPQPESPEERPLVHMVNTFQAQLIDAKQTLEQLIKDAELLKQALRKSEK